MGKILLIWTYESDLVECPDYIANDLSSYVNDFDAWLCNKENKHGYWTKNCEGDDALGFDSEAFVDWINTFIIQKDDCKATFLKRSFQPNEDEMKLPHVYF